MGEDRQRKMRKVGVLRGGKLQYIINEYAKNESDVIAELEEIKSIKDSVTSEEVKEKYEWLINYYLWFIEMCNKKKISFDMSKFSHLYNERNKSFIFTSC